MVPVTKGRMHFSKGGCLICSRKSIRFPFTRISKVQKIVKEAYKIEHLSRGVLCYFCQKRVNKITGRIIYGSGFNRAQNVYYRTRSVARNLPIDMIGSTSQMLISKPRYEVDSPSQVLLKEPESDGNTDCLTQVDVDVQVDESKTVPNTAAQLPVSVDESATDTDMSERALIMQMLLRAQVKNVIVAFVDVMTAVLSKIDEIR
ncbi:uncharacterized protein LOC143922762 [Arctopsyche grandis]|uniref:uncharacterized protein LOC143922762 n=1 Tax=Arctopsyche grandis TaxID=121162 RepID=UPI00406D6492